MPDRPDPARDPLSESPLCAADPLARQLAGLEPAPPALTRDALMFAAGAASRDRSVRFWRRLVAAQTTAAVVLVGVGVAAPEVFNARGPGPMDTAAVPPAATPKKEAESLTPPPDRSADPPQYAVLPEPDDTAAARAKYLRMRADVYLMGLQVLPSGGAVLVPLDAASLEQQLRLPPGVLAVPPRPAKPNDDQ